MKFLCRLVLPSLFVGLGCAFACGGSQSSEASSPGRNTPASATGAGDSCEAAGGICTGLIQDDSNGCPAGRKLLDPKNTSTCNSSSGPINGQVCCIPDNGPINTGPPKSQGAVDTGPPKPAGAVDAGAPKPEGPIDTGPPKKP